MTLLNLTMALILLMFSTEARAQEKTASSRGTCSVDECSVIKGVSPITVIAGDGIPGFSGDGGPATAAKLNQPTGIERDSDGNIFILDSGNQRVRMIDGKTGIITTVAGTGSSWQSKNGGPADAPASIDSINIGSDGNLYAVDTNGHLIRRVINRTTPMKPPLGDEWKEPLRISSFTSGFVSPDKSLYLMDKKSNKVRRIDCVCPQ